MFDSRPRKKFVNTGAKDWSFPFCLKTDFAFRELSPKGSLDGLGIAFILAFGRFLNVSIVILKTHPPSSTTFVKRH
jgi:hypothetical protein